MDQKQKKVLFLVIFCLLYLTMRFWAIEQDPKFPLLSRVATIDELYYTIPAFDLYQYGSLTYTPVQAFPNDSNGMNFVGNIFTYASLLGFGKSLVGLRAGSVFAGLLIALGMFVLFRKLDEADESDEVPLKVTNLIWPVYLSVFFLVEYSVFTETIYHRPILYHMLGIIGSMLLLLWHEKKLENTAAGFAAGALLPVLTVCIYPSAVFILPAYFAAFLLPFKKENWKVTVVTVLGLLFALLCLYAGAQVLFEGNSVPDWGYFATRSTEYPYPYPDPIKVLNIFASNTFRTSPLFAVLFLWGLPPYIYHAWRTRSRVHGFVLLMFFSYFCQQSLSDNYVYKKNVAIVPLILIVALRGLFVYRDEFVRTLGRFRVGSKSVSYAVLWVPVVLYVSWWARSKFPKDLDLVELVNSRVLVATGVAVSTLALVWIQSKKKQVMAIHGLWIAALVLSASITLQSYFNNPGYLLRDFGERTAAVVDGKIIGGGYVHALRPWSNAIPVANPYIYRYSKDRLRYYIDNMVAAVESGTISYMLGYRILPQEFEYKLNFSIVDETEISTYGPNKHLYLYHVTPKIIP